MTAPYYEALPTDLRPSHYDLLVSDISMSKETFHGRVAIEFIVDVPTDEVHLNYRDLNITKEGVTVGDGSVGVVSLEKFPAKEYFVIKLLAKIDGRVTVVLEYDGQIQNNMAGFYKSAYVEGGKEKFMLSTQFEATDARRAFPCMDEPNRKATFGVAVEVRDDWVVLGNMPVASEILLSESLESEAINARKSANSNSASSNSTNSTDSQKLSSKNSGVKRVTFQATPIMSTYLLAWACGDFEYIESFTSDVYTDNKPLPVRIYTTPGYLQDAELASQIAPKIVDYFSKIFEIKYPLPKLDLIAVHSFSHNAMENWGLITYRSTALLFSEEKSDPIYKQKVAYVVAHELAHQWFGNLVTMKWWDELWLNEGFATWVGYAAVDFLYPEWDIFKEFVSQSLQTALNLDSLRNSHPIEVPVVDALDIDQVFDTISYLKGASTILMISNYLGTDLFLKGVALYLKRNEFGNATSHDLWGAIGEVANLPIDHVMNSWIKKVGFPLVSVKLEDDKVVISQQRFLSSGDVTPEENNTKWWIPLRVDGALAVDALDDREVVVKGKLGSNYFKLNKDSAGVYRVNYSPEILEHNVLPYIGKMSAKDKIGLVSDLAATSIAGNTSTSTFLTLVMTLINNNHLGDDYPLWLSLNKELGHIFRVFGGDFTKLQNVVYETKALQFVDSIKQGHVEGDFLTIKLRSLVLGRSVGLNIPQVDSYALELFEKWTAGHAIDPSLRYFVFSSIAASRDFSRSQFDAILKEVTHPTSLDSREIALQALGKVQNKEFYTELLSYIIRPDIIPTMDSHYLSVPMSYNHVSRDALWEFFITNYDEIYRLMSTNMVVLDRFVKTALCNYQSMEKYHEIETFFSNKDVHGFERAYRQALDKVRINAEWASRDGHVVREFLAQL